jgi:hypothetical protein
MEGLKQNAISQYFQSPTNVQDGIRAGAFQGKGYLGKAPGIFLGDVYPYSFTPNYSETPLLTGSIPANSSVYLPLGTINFASFPNYVTLESGTMFPSGKCVKFDYERTLQFTSSENCEVTISLMDIYFQKIVKKYTFEESALPNLIQPIKYLCSIKVTNVSSSTMSYTLSLGQGFAIPYNMLFSAANFTKMILYDGFPLITALNPPSIITWLPTINDGADVNFPATITSTFPRPYFDYSPLFIDNGPFQNRPFNGERIITTYTQHYGFGNLPSFATPDEQKKFLNGNNVSILGVKPFSENFVPWFS